MTTHKQGIGLILYAHGVTGATTRCQYLMQVMRDPTSDGAAGNDKVWNWNEQAENYDYVNQAYDDSVSADHTRLLHDFGGAQTESQIQDYIVNTLGFNALPDGMVLRCKTKPYAQQTGYNIAEPGLDSAGVTEYLELDGAVNPVTIPTSGTQKFWTPTDSGGTYGLYFLLWDYRPLIDTFAGRAIDAGWRYRWNDGTNTVEMSFDGANWFPITDGTVTTLQDALNVLATAYPTEDYDAAIDSNNIIYVRPGSGGAGTITFNSEFQTILDEENGTFVLNTGRKINYEKWA